MPKEYKLRKDLTPLPRHMLGLPIEKRGYPVPAFVEYIDGLPEFRVMDSRFLVKAVQERLCWVCGGPLGAHLAFPVGPMCCINRISGEPPCHRDCAEWSAVNCPFLSRPHMERRPTEDVVADDGTRVIINPAMNPRNPAVAAIWITRSYKRERIDNTHTVFHMGEPEEILWYREGKPAARDQVDVALADGLTLLLKAAAEEGDEGEILIRGLRSIAGLLPKAAA